MADPATEDEVARLLRAGEFDAATTVALRGYGPEVLGFLVAVSRNEADARDAFSELSEDLWRGLPKFAGNSSLRTWLYTIARRALWRVMNDPRRHPDRNMPLSGVVEKVAAEVRESTMTHLRTEVKDGFAQLRAQLAPDEQMLLVLRVDRDLAWRDIAGVMHEGESESQLDDAALDREAAALRKRFERIKVRLRELGEKAGLARR